VQKPKFRDLFPKPTTTSFRLIVEFMLKFPKSRIFTVVNMLRRTPEAKEHAMAFTADNVRDVRATLRRAKSQWRRRAAGLTAKRVEEVVDHKIVLGEPVDVAKLPVFEASPAVGPANKAVKEMMIQEDKKFLDAVSEPLFMPHDAARLVTKFVKDAGGLHRARKMLECLESYQVPQ